MPDPWNCGCVTLRIKGEGIQVLNGIKVANQLTLI